jgi:tryptophan synthase beta chain
VAYALKVARELKRDQLLVINLSGRGDKDVDTVAGMLGGETP